MIAIAISNFLVMLAVVPVMAVLPLIAAQLSVDVTTASWIMTAYLLGLTSFLLIGGRLGDLYGHREVFILGALLFTIAGTACAVPQHFGLLIVLRALQGIGAALISGNSLAIIAHSFTPRERGTAIGVAAAFAALGSVVGTLSGTYLSQIINWQSLFYITLPVGLVAVAAAWRLERVRVQGAAALDVWGAVLLAAALISLSLTLTNTHSHTAGAGLLEQWPFQSSMLALTALFTVLFVIAEKRAARPIIDLRFMTHGPFAWAVVANAMLHMTMMSSVPEDAKSG